MKNVNLGLRCTLGLLVLAVPGVGAPIQWSIGVGGNGHYYDTVSPQTSTGPTWFEASSQASTLVNLGQSGYLVTITSAAEQAFLEATFGLSGLNNRWIGGFQPAGSPEPAGGWQWVTGEPGPVAPNYTNWGIDSPEPNDGGGAGGEDGIVFRTDLQWNDITRLYTSSGFVVEFDSVPEPGTMALMGLGLALAVGLRRRTKA